MMFRRVVERPPTITESLHMALQEIMSGIDHLEQGSVDVPDCFHQAFGLVLDVLSEFDPEVAEDLWESEEDDDEIDEDKFRNN